MDGSKNSSNSSRCRSMGRIGWPSQRPQGYSKDNTDRSVEEVNSSIQWRVCSITTWEFLGMHANFWELAWKSVLTRCPNSFTAFTGFILTRLIDIESMMDFWLVITAGIQVSDKRYVCLSHQRDTVGTPSVETKEEIVTTGNNLAAVRIRRSVLKDFQDDVWRRYSYTIFLQWGISG